MKKGALFLIGGMLLWGCQGGQEAGKGQREAKGGVVYGGVFKVNEVEDFRTLYPLDMTEVYGHRVANQVYEGLVKLSQTDLSVQPSIAERWESNEDATSFTFYLRKGVKFHNDPCFPESKGREVTANDFKYSFTQLCSANNDNQNFFLFDKKVAGASEYYQSTVDGSPMAEGVEGIKVIDDYTLKINLNYPFAGFLNILTHSGCWVFPKEAYDKYGVDMRIKCVGTGPFIVKNIKEGEAVILERNNEYWGVDQHGNKLPYLDAIKITFLKEKKAELMEFRKGNLDMVLELPLEMIGDVVGELDEAKRGGNVPFDMQITPGMLIQYYGFQHKSELFSDKRVRLAFNHAIDRDAIVDYTLQGDGISADNGIVPPGFKGFDYDSLTGYDFNPEKARKLLSEAGYPDGKGFPKLTLQLNSGGSNRVQMAEVIQKMLQENLNIEMELNVMQFGQHLDNLETGKALFWRSGWVADYPDPEIFLNILYGGHVPDELEERSYINSVRYQSSSFDSLFVKAQQTIDFKERMRLYRKATQVAIDDAAVLPLYYDEHTRLLQKHVKNFPGNAMEYRDFTEVYLKYEEL